MSVIFLELAGLNIQDTPDLFPSSHWDGYAPNPLPQAFSQGTAFGLGNTWGALTLIPAINQLTNIPYIGYDTNFGASIEPVVIPFKSIPYIGYNTNFAATPYNNVSEFTQVDLDSVIEYPKAQFVYIKLKGFNPNTQTYENWVIKEDITSRPELFDPGRHPPTVERDVYRAPPSGHALVNITIIARWIQ